MSQKEERKLCRERLADTPWRLVEPFERIGQGGQASVWKVERPSGFGAMKLSVQADKARARFEREVYLLKQAQAAGVRVPSVLLSPRVPPYDWSILEWLPRGSLRTVRPGPADAQPHGH